MVASSAQHMVEEDLQVFLVLLEHPGMRGGLGSHCRCAFLEGFKGLWPEESASDLLVRLAITTPCQDVEKIPTRAASAGIAHGGAPLRGHHVSQQGEGGVELWRQDTMGPELLRVQGEGSEHVPAVAALVEIRRHFGGGQAHGRASYYDTLML